MPELCFVWHNIFMLPVMPLNVNIFYSHNLDERMEIINQKGEFITRIKYYGFWIDLFLVDDVFAEVFYNIHTHLIEEVELIEHDEARLNIYAAGVDISDLDLY